MQTGISIGCLLVLLLIGVPFAIKYPWRAAMVVTFFAVHIAVMVGYAALIARLMQSQRPAARRLVAAHEKLSALLGDAPPYDGPEHKVLRTAVQVAVYLPALVFYFALLLWLGDVLDWLEQP